jgi:hypothetical protein
METVIAEAEKLTINETVPVSIALGDDTFKTIPGNRLMTSIPRSEMIDYLGMPEGIVSIDRVTYNDQGSAEWYRREYGDRFPQYMCEIMAAYSNGMQYKDMKYLLKKLRKKDKAGTVIKHGDAKVTFN